MLVLAVDVSQSAASPTMSNPVESWLKYLGWAGRGGGGDEREAAVWTFDLESKTHFKYATHVFTLLKTRSRRRLSGFNCSLRNAAASSDRECARSLVEGINTNIGLSRLWLMKQNTHHTHTHTHTHWGALRMNELHVKHNVSQIRAEFTK